MNSKATRKATTHRAVRPTKCWIVVNRKNQPVLWSGSVPVFWRRSVARQAATEHGFSTYGPAADAAIVPIVISSGPR